MNSFIPKIGVGIERPMGGDNAFVSAIGSVNLSDMGNIAPIQDTPNGGFKNVMTNLTNSLNSTMNAPDALLKDAVMGNGVDVHDVVLAMSKAEIGVNIASQLTTKIVQSYEKIMSIQV